jgi:hypothetical protein
MQRKKQTQTFPITFLSIDLITESAKAVSDGMVFDSITYEVKLKARKTNRSYSFRSEDYQEQSRVQRTEPGRSSASTNERKLKGNY